MSDLVLSDRIPKVALVGRPNVGKSTLFNCLLKSRKAITDPTPGVTRDPNEADWVLDGHPVKLVDTGGYKTRGDDLDAAITAKSIARAKDADLVLLILDLMELTAEDEEFVRLLRPLSDKLIVVLNKADGMERESLMGEFYSLGFSEYICVSAAHNRRIDELEELIAGRLKFSDAVVEDVEPDLRLAILGKPNAGKSTLVNRLTGLDLSIVSPEPGTTRDPIEGRFEFKGTAFRVVDTAGIRRRGKVGENVEVLFGQQGSQDDCRERRGGFAHRRGRRTQRPRQEDRLPDRQRRPGNHPRHEQMGPAPQGQEPARGLHRPGPVPLPHPRLCPGGSLVGQERHGDPRTADHGAQGQPQLHQRIDTSKLNEMLKIWMEDVPTAQVKGVVYKIRYLTQVSTLPVKFVAFGNHGKDTPGSLTEYLVNRIRKDLGFQDVPIELNVKGGQEK